MKIKLIEITSETEQIMADLYQYNQEPTFSIYEALEGGDAERFAGRKCKAGY